MDQTYLLLIVLVVGIGICAIYLYWMKQANAAKSKWGINLKTINPSTKIYCPGCGSDQPKIRKPANLKQLLWGGFTCKSCGKEYDKWLQEIHS